MPVKNKILHTLPTLVERISYVCGFTSTQLCALLVWATYLADRRYVIVCSSPFLCLFHDQFGSGDRNHVYCGDSAAPRAQFVSWCLRRSLEPQSDAHGR